MQKLFRNLTVIIFLLLICFGGANAAHSNVDDFCYLFITGYGAESVPGYFTENANEVRKEGATNVLIIEPPTFSAVLDNVAFVRSEALKFLAASQADGKKRKLIVMAHSKGGVEFLNTWLQNPNEFSEDALEMAVLVQSPLLGSTYSDVTLGPLEKSLEGTPGYQDFEIKHAGRISLMTKNVAKAIEFSSANLTHDQISSISKRLFYWRSEKKTAFTPVLVGIEKVIKPFGDNDGAVLTRNEKLTTLRGQTFGTDLGITHGIDHHDVVAEDLNPSQFHLARIRRVTRQILMRTWNPGSQSSVSLEFEALSCEDFLKL